MASTASPLRQYRRYDGVDLSRYRKFVVAGRHVGWVSPSVAKLARSEPRLFSVDSATVRVQNALARLEERNQAMAETLSRWREKGVVAGWRSELYPVNTRFGETPLLLMERAATPLFGVLCYGVNVNGLTWIDGERAAWIARRSPTKPIDPGKLDVMVGGGQPHGLSIVENVLKECAEEAGVPAALALRAKPVGILTLLIAAGEGLRVGLQFNFDLELPEDFTPSNADGEVAEFFSWPLERIFDNLCREDEFMYDIALAKIDLLIRSGHIGPDRRDFVDLVRGLRRPIPFEAA
jgi:8-oxo-dGTP pyrophosphatase MutT (NUDIX family)